MRMQLTKSTLSLVAIQSGKFKKCRMSKPNTGLFSTELSSTAQLSIILITV